jgi:antitoxin YefM
MYAIYRVNADELDNRFLESLKRQFEHKDIEIVVCETEQSALDETAYLLSSPANRERLLKAIARVERGENLVTIDMDELQ